MKYKLFLLSLLAAFTSLASYADDVKEPTPSTQVEPIEESDDVIIIEEEESAEKAGAN